MNSKALVKKPPLNIKNLTILYSKDHQLSLVYTLDSGAKTRPMKIGTVHPGDTVSVTFDDPNGTMSIRGLLT